MTVQQKLNIHIFPTSSQLVTMTHNNIHQYLRSGPSGLILEIYGYLIFAVLSSNDAYYVVWMIDDLIKDIY